MTKKYYTAIVDQTDRQDRFWFSGSKRKLTDDVAALLLKGGKIIEADMRPKKFVEITCSDGTKTTMTWGDYLKEKKRIIKK